MSDLCNLVFQATDSTGHAARKGQLLVIHMHVDSIKRLGISSRSCLNADICSSMLRAASGMSCTVFDMLQLNVTFRS